MIVKNNTPIILKIKTQRTVYEIGPNSSCDVEQTHEMAININNVDLVDIDYVIANLRKLALDIERMYRNKI